jgi:hypothetical protein
MAKKNIEDLREMLFATIELLQTGKISIDRAEAISGIAQVMVASAKVEVEFAKAAGLKSSAFLGSSLQMLPGPQPAGTAGTPAALEGPGQQKPEHSTQSAQEVTDVTATPVK